MALTEFGTVTAVKALVTDAVFKRAQEIAESGKLSAVVFEEGDESLSLLKGRAVCIGSSPSDVYSLSVSIDVEGPAAVGVCSCPAGKSAKSGLCKHAVALLLRRIQEAQSRRSQKENGIVDGTKGISREEEGEDVVVSIASQQVGSDTGGGGSSQQPTTKNAFGGGSQPQSTLPKGIGSSTSVASSPKRALPAWMLGVTASTPLEPPANPPKSRKRGAATAAAAAPARSRPPRPLPPLARRARRGPSGRQLRISSEGGEEEGEEVEDPGEVDDGGPMEMEVEVEESEGKESRPRSRPKPRGDVVVLSEEEVEDPVVESPNKGPATEVLSEGAAARERRRLKALKKEQLAAAAAEAAQRTAGDDDDEEGGTKGFQGRRRRGSNKSSAPKTGRGGAGGAAQAQQTQAQAQDQDLERPVQASKRRRLVKKRVPINDDIDFSEDEITPPDFDEDNDDHDDKDEFRLTEDDLRLLAQENLQSESTGHIPAAKDLRAEAGCPGRVLERVEEEQAAEPKNKSPQRTRTSSLRKWRDLTSSSDAGGGGTSYGASTFKKADLDLETLRTVSQETSSQALGLLDGISSLDSAAAGTSYTNVPTFAPPTGTKDIPSATAPMAAPSDDSDTVAASMLSLWFGPDIGGQIADKHVPIAQGSEDFITTPATSTAAPAPASASALYSLPEKSADPGAKTRFHDDVVAVQSQPKKKASLKDKLKMFSDF